jgi:hypothetical protein
VLLIDTRQPPPEPPGRRPHLDWRPSRASVLGVVLLVTGTTSGGGIVSLALVLVGFALGCFALLRAVGGDGRGLSEYRQ